MNIENMPTVHLKQIYTVYILFSMADKRLYVGCTSNIVQRLERHNRGHVKATARRRPLILIHQENYEIRAEAFDRERFLKTLWAGRFKKKLRAEYIKKLSI